MEKYGNWGSRVSALLIDVFLLLVMIFVITTIFNQMDYYVASSVREFIFFGLFLLEPLLISFLGATPGQFVCKLRVKREKDVTRNISFFAALYRFFIKVTCGFISLLLLNTSKKHKAIHDTLVSSVVIDISDTGPLKKSNAQINDELIDTGF